jgi:archaellum biogenesis ATPase FlaH
MKTLPNNTAFESALDKRDYTSVISSKPTNERDSNVSFSVATGSVVANDFDDLPVEMLSAKRWLLYKKEPNQDSNKKPRKVPYYTTGIKRHGALDTPADQEKFASFEEALLVLNTGGYAGLGFALGTDGGTGNYWQGIDIDGISDHPELSDVVSDLPGYTEKSPSGNGMHAIGYGRKFETLGSNSTGIEAYSSGRFFTVTADYSGMHPPSCLAAFVEKRLAPMHRSKAKSAETYDDSICESITSGQMTDLRSALFHLRADDRELWVQIGHALKGLGNVGRGLFMNWSSQSDKFDPKDTASKWESFKPTKTSYKAIFKIAKEAGWLNPASNAAQANFKGYSSNSHNKCDTNPYDLDTFALNGQSADLEKQLLDDKFILGRIAILGQVTVIYAPPNTGKTLLMLAMLREGIKSGEVEAANVYFVNADDHFKGAVQKLKLAEESGFKMLVPSYNGFKAEMMEAILREQCLMGKARGMVLILDTMKKFTDLMSKSKGTDFMKAVREFVSHGGSIILLAHTNKHRNEAGGLIFAGTADVVDDCDCAYTLDTVTSNTEAGVKSVKFENFKARGDNAVEEVYQYDISDGMSYVAKLESVQLLSKEEKQLALKRKAVDGLLARNADAIKVIERLIRSGTTKKTEIIKAAGDDGISKAKTIKVLREHEGANLIVGQRWTVTIIEKNSHVYKLNLIT